MAGRGSGWRWVGATSAPWALGCGLLVSFTASAGIDAMAGASLAPGYVAERPLDGRLVPAFPLPLAAEPATTLRDGGKSARGGSLVVARDGKGDPAAERAPTLSRRGLEIARAAGPPIADRLVFVTGTRELPPTVLMRGPVTGPDWENGRGFEPWGEDAATTLGTSTVNSPAAAAAGSTGAGRGPDRRNADGRTPTTPRAVALASATPAPTTPLEVAAAPVSTPPAPGTTPPAAPPRYAELIAAATSDREQRCLAEAVYFEARSESEDGRAAVAQVVLNRVRSGLYPPSICGVVYQNRHRHLACQFTFACEGKALRITESAHWEAAKRIARDVTDGRTYLAEVGGATHYHADYVNPYWARRLRKMDVIGRHVFYQLRPGQT